MTKTNTRPVATRLTLEELAKCRDGLIIKGIDKNDLQSTSQILRLAVYYMILECTDPQGPPSQESAEFIHRLWNQTKSISLDELSSK